MPRGIAKSQAGKLNARQARELAKRVETERPGWRAQPFPIAQGLAVVYVTDPDGIKRTLRRAEDWVVWDWRTAHDRPD